MMKFLNYKTIYEGNSAKQFNDIKSVLESLEIPYKHQTIDLQHNDSLGGHGVNRSFGGNNNNRSNLLYEIRVRSSDYDHALYVIHKAGK